MNILVTTTSFAGMSGAPIEKLHAFGAKIITNPHAQRLTKSQLKVLLQEYEPPGILAGTEIMDREVLQLAQPFLRIISRIGVGIDAIDLDAAREYGIQVARTEGVLGRPVAELALGMILNALRHIGDGDRRIRGGIWKKEFGSLLQGKSVGIVGFGDIGQTLGHLLTGMGCKVAYTDPIDYGIEWATRLSMAELLEKSDIVSLHANASEVILTEKEIASMKRGVVVVNTARGALIDEGPLLKGLDDGRIGYACLDVFQNEPYKGPLSERNNVVLTPHIGSYAKESRIQMEMMAVDNLIAGLSKKAC